jgi:hypothetical protein
MLRRRYCCCILIYDFAQKVEGGWAPAFPLDVRKNFSQTYSNSSNYGRPKFSGMLETGAKTAKNVPLTWLII